MLQFKWPISSLRFVLKLFACSVCLVPGVVVACAVTDSDSKAAVVCEAIRNANAESGIKGMSEGIVPVHRQYCEEGGQKGMFLDAACESAKGAIAISLFEQGRYQVAFGYFQSLEGEIKKSDSRDVDRTCLGRAIRLGALNPQFSFNNLNWYLYESANRAGHSDANRWLHPAYLCALMSDIGTASSAISIVGSYSDFEKKKWETWLIGGQHYKFYLGVSDSGVLTPPLGETISDDDRNNLRNQGAFVAKIYVEAVRKSFGEVDATVTRKFLDAIYLPLTNAAKKFEFSSNSYSNTAESRKRANTAMLFENAANEARKIGLPNVYVDFLSDRVRYLRGTVKTFVQ